MWSRARGDVVGYREWSYDRRTDRFEEGRTPQTTSPDYILVMESPLPRYEKVLGPIQERLDSSYLLLKSFIAIDLEEERNRFDPIDAFYIPYAGFHGIERPGPNINVYRRTSP